MTVTSVWLWNVFYREMCIDQAVTTTKQKQQPKKFISTIQMFHKDINIRVVFCSFTSKRFSGHRSGRQGRPVSPFLFVMVTELLSRSSINTPKIQGWSIFNREIRVQLSDDPEWFLKNKKQLEAAIQIIDKFWQTSGLKVNMSKCEMMSLQDQLINQSVIFTSKTVKYFDVSKNNLV